MSEAPAVLVAPSYFRDRVSGMLPGPRELATFDDRTEKADAQGRGAG
jgi:hypothetical protein